jgi:hypothetical protein
MGVLSLGPSAIFKYLQKVGMPATARSTKADSVVSEEQSRTSRNAAGSTLSSQVRWNEPVLLALNIDAQCNVFVTWQNLNRY